MVCFITTLVVILALGFCALIIFLIVRFFRWIFSPVRSAQAANPARPADEIAVSKEFQQFSSERIEYWNKIISQQKAAGVFDETKKVYETGEYKGVKYSIIRSSRSDTKSEDEEADLMVQMLIYSQLQEGDFE